MNDLPRLRAQYYWSRIRTFVRGQMFINRMLGGASSKQKNDQKGDNRGMIKPLSGREDDESTFACLVHINSNFYILWETIYAFSAIMFALFFPYTVATRNLQYMTAYQEHLYYIWFIYYFFAFDLLYNCVV
jgi:hypothetical protein